MLVPVVANIAGSGLINGAEYFRFFVMPTSNGVDIRRKRRTRDKLHSIKNPGQTLDGIITRFIDLCEPEKLEVQQAKKE